MIPERARCTPRSWYHAELVEAYRAQRLAEEERYDVDYGGTTVEAAEHRHEMITFARFLMTWKGSRNE